jgi:hypothetical protein
VLTYEVTAIVDPAIAGDYERYMRTVHIPEVLASGCFLAASFGRSEPGRYRIRYEVADRATLDRYIAEHAPRLRADVERHFPSGVTTSREVWDGVEVWPPEDARAR